jgi:hypothetical protein
VENVDKQQHKQEKKSVLGIFAKQPLAGQVKTRLCPPLSEEEAATLYRVALTETVTRMRQGHGYDLVICYAGERSWFETAFPEITLMAQHGADLGARMATALNSFLSLGYLKAVLIGSDTPDLPLASITRAFRALDCADLVLGPALDGGYYLIGEGVHHPELFTSIPWSSDQVLSLTKQKAQALGMNTDFLSEWEDLDDFAALKRYLRTSQGCTARFMRQKLAHHFAVE